MNSAEMANVLKYLVLLDKQLLFGANLIVD
jgi:hypothetical protein